MCQSHAPVGTVTYQYLNVPKQSQSYTGTGKKITPIHIAANRVSHKINYEVVLSTHCGVYAVVLGRIELPTYFIFKQYFYQPYFSTSFSGYMYYFQQCKDRQNL